MSKGKEHAYGHSAEGMPPCHDGEYDTMYSSFSSITHGTAFDRRVSIGEGQEVIFEPFRGPTGLKMMLTYVPIIALKTYRMILKHYRPLETENLSKKYAEQWRTPLHTIKDVEQKVTFIPRP